MDEPLKVAQNFENALEISSSDSVMWILGVTDCQFNAERAFRLSSFLFRQNCHSTAFACQVAEVLLGHVNLGYKKIAKRSKTLPDLSAVPPFTCFPPHSESFP